MLLLQRTRVQVTAPTLSSFPVTLAPRDPVSFLASRVLHTHAQTYNQTNMHTHNLKKKSKSQQQTKQGNCKGITQWKKTNPEVFPESCAADQEITKW